jgi:hypothetical protein
MAYDSNRFRCLVKDEEIEDQGIGGQGIGSSVRPLRFIPDNVFYQYDDKERDERLI